MDLEKIWIVRVIRKKDNPEINETIIIRTVLFLLLFLSKLLNALFVRGDEQRFLSFIDNITRLSSAWFADMADQGVVDRNLAGFLRLTEIGR